MLNRWWSVSETCGELDTSLSFGVEDVEQCCATSRHIIIGATSPQAAPLWACQRLCMVCHLRWPLDAVAGLMAIRPMEQSLPTHNRASGCNFYNLALTTSVAKSATWGKSMNPKDINRGAVADSAIKVI